MITIFVEISACHSCPQPWKLMWLIASVCMVGSVVTSLVSNIVPYLHIYECPTRLVGIAYQLGRSALTDAARIRDGAMGSINTVRCQQNGCHFVEGIFKCILLKEKFILIKISSWGSYWQFVSIGWGNGLVPEGTEPLPEPMLTKIHTAMWHHQVSLSYIQVNYNRVLHA